jgi:hypothetical protein
MNQVKYNGYILRILVNLNAGVWDQGLELSTPVNLVRCVLRYVTVVQYSATRRRLKKVVKVIYVSCRINSFWGRLSKVLKSLQKSQYSHISTLQPAHGRNILFSLDLCLIKRCYILCFVCTWSIEEKRIKHESVSILLGSENHFRRRYLQRNTLDAQIKWFNFRVLMSRPIRIAARSEARIVFARSIPGILNSNPTQYMGICLRLFCFCVR